MIDYNDPKIKAMIDEMIKLTGQSREELIEQYEYAFRNIKYVKIIKGEYKGKVGYLIPEMLPDGNLFPYSKILYFPNGDILMCNGWSYMDIERITKEEYERECEKENE